MGQLFSGIGNATGTSNFTGSLTNAFGGIGNTIGSIGGLTNGISQGFTPQNQFQSDLTGIEGEQQGLANALLAQSQGQGPNPAQAQLTQNTNQNIAQNTGMIASQKGVSPALAARLASENAGSMNQNAAASAATLGAQQQLAAQQQLGGVYNNIGNEQLGSGTINANVAGQNAAANQATSAGLLNGIGGSGMLSSLGMGAKSSGGTIGYAGGGSVGNDPSLGILDQSQYMNQNPIAAVAGSGAYPANGNKPAPDSGGGGDSGGGLGALAGLAALLAHGGSVEPHMAIAMQAYHPHMLTQGPAKLKSGGGNVPGKAQVKGDSPKNDTVKTMLSPGEVVIPRSVMESNDPVSGASAFVAQELAKHGKQSKATPEDFKAALKAHIGSRKGK